MSFNLRLKPVIGGVGAIGDLADFAECRSKRPSANRIGQTRNSCVDVRCGQQPDAAGASISGLHHQRAVNRSLDADAPGLRILVAIRRDRVSLVAGRLGGGRRDPIWERTAERVCGRPEWKLGNVVSEVKRYVELVAVENAGASVWIDKTDAEACANNGLGTVAWRKRQPDPRRKIYVVRSPQPW